jgi:uncharacterized protein YacL
MNTAIEKQIRGLWGQIILYVCATVVGVPILLNRIPLYLILVGVAINAFMIFLYGAQIRALKRSQSDHQVKAE